MKPMNVLLRKPWNPLTQRDVSDLFVADFGIASQVQTIGTRLTAQRGTPGYEAPEIRGQGYQAAFSQKSDNPMVLDDIKPSDISPDYSIDLLGLICTMLDSDREQRPNATQVKEKLAALALQLFPPASLHCKSCHQSFPSKSQLDKHLKDRGNPCRYNGQRKPSAIHTPASDDGGLKIRGAAAAPPQHHYEENATEDADPSPCVVCVKHFNSKHRFYAHLHGANHYRGPTSVHKRRAELDLDTEKERAEKREKRLTDWINNQILSRQNTGNADTARIHVSNHEKGLAEHIVPRSLIRTSAVLRAQLNARVICIYFHGSLHVFDLYRAWLNTRNVLTTSELADNNQSEGTTTKEDYICLLCCWGLGHTLQDTLYQDMVASSIIQRVKAWTGTTTVPFVYALTSSMVGIVYGDTAANAPLRRLVVDLAARHGKEADFAHFRQDSAYPAGFIKELMVALGREKERLSAQVQSLRRSQAPPPRASPFPVPSPRRPSTPMERAPTPLFNPDNGRAARQNPPEVSRRNSMPNPSGGAKQVSFQGGRSGPVNDKLEDNEISGNKNSAVLPDECVYHLHTRTGAPCWRAGQ
ncbi:hypothetical protein N0V83_001412 [Neocucurbitaria cava]|uniref:non-specific serine/threonine protein kinase n=1 Tax=Neocucurbitaria cava TaxID=798079 RepID=A0A9W9CQE2_9PLEO|nr:hypothetical protein N0V83_001412 [Neocucurbitaria cava]